MYRYTYRTPNDRTPNDRTPNDRTPNDTTPNMTQHLMDRIPKVTEHLIFEHIK